MTADEYKTLYPRDVVKIQVDDETRIMSQDEYETWVANSIADIESPQTRTQG